MSMLYEILPVIIFFAAFKYFDIYVATSAGIIATTVQVLLTRAFTGQWDRKQIITMLVFMVFGGMTLYFHDPIFVKWKPTIVFWIFAAIIIISACFTQKSLVQRMLESAMPEANLVPVRVWRHLNILWVIFFVSLGGLNLYMAYQYSNDAWVNFKLYGITSALVLISVIQSVYLFRYIQDKDKKPHECQ